MLIKLGVDISRLDRHIRRILNDIDIAYRMEGQEAVITSTYEGNHTPSSLHYANQAIDIRLPKANLKRIMDHLVTHIPGDKYDIVKERDHIHIEYDPHK